MKDSKKIVLLLASFLMVLAIAFLVSMHMDPQPKLKFVTGEVAFTNNLDQVPDRIFPLLEDRNPRLYLFWREVCHFMGSCLFMIIAYLLFLLGLKRAPECIFVILLIWITFQEAYLHPLRYNQPEWNGVLDWFVWVVPFVAFIFVMNIESGVRDEQKVLF